MSEKIATNALFDLASPYPLIRAGSWSLSKSHFGLKEKDLTMVIVATISQS